MNPTCVHSRLVYYTFCGLGILGYLLGLLFYIFSGLLSLLSLSQFLCLLSSAYSFTLICHGNNFPPTPAILIASLILLLIIKQVATWSSHSAKVNLLYLFGDHILSVDADHHMFIWAFKGIQQNLEPLSHIFLEGNFSPTCIVHPDTYLNKVKTFLQSHFKLCRLSFFLFLIYKYCSYT